MLYKIIFVVISGEILHCPGAPATCVNKNIKIKIIGIISYKIISLGGDTKLGAWL
jgi:hypothetical protein